MTPLSESKHFVHVPALLFFDLLILIWIHASLVDEENRADINVFCLQKMQFHH